MTIDQLLKILGDSIPPGIFAVMTVYLFLKMREDQAKRDADQRADAAAHEKQLREDRAVEQAKSDEREKWFRDTIEKVQPVLLEINASLRKLVERQDDTERRVTRMEDKRIVSVGGGGGGGGQ